MKLKLLPANRVFISIALVFSANPAWALSHSLINSTRPSEANVVVNQAVEGEYGRVQKYDAGAVDPQGAGAIWRGYGIKNAVGLELMRFTQFTASHTFMNLRSKADSLENIHGSRFGLGVKFIFAAPIGNLEAGGGVTGGRYDYQRQLDAAEFLASGYNFTLGVNYFMSSKVSVFSEAKGNRENLVRNGGSAAIERITTDTSTLGLGVSLWL